MASSKIPARPRMLVSAPVTLPVTVGIPNMMKTEIIFISLDAK